MKECEVIVVGAGISGVSAAKLLHESGIDVVVLEARDRVGGRTWTVRKPEVGYVDLGGSYVGPTQNNLLRMAKELGLETYKVDETQDSIFYSKGKARKYTCNDAPAIGGFMDQLDLNHLIRTMDKMGKEIPCEAPWEAPHAWEWDRMTFQDFIMDTCHTKAARDFATMFLNMILTAEPWEASLLWVLWYVKVCDGMKRILSTTNGAQERKFIGGSQQISERIYERLGPQRVHLSQPVHQIIQNGDGEVYVKTLDGSEYKAKYVIQATPPAVQQKIHYSPELPALRNQLLQRLPVGAVMKCILYYKKAFWKELGFCGSILATEDGHEFDMQFTLNDTKPDGSKPAIVGFIATDRLRRNYEALTKEERKVKLAENLSKIFKSSDALSPVHYEEKCWSEEQYSGGCYATVWAPGLLTTHGHVLRRPVGKMYFAGTETATWWSCYMEGAVSSGERAAREVLHDMGKLRKNEIWKKEVVSKEVPEIPFPTTTWEKYAPSAKCLSNAIKILTWTAVGVGACWAFKKFGANPDFRAKLPVTFATFK